MFAVTFKENNDDCGARQNDYHKVFSVKEVDFHVWFLIYSHTNEWVWINSDLVNLA